MHTDNLSKSLPTVVDGRILLEEKCVAKENYNSHEEVNWGIMKLYSPHPLVQ